MTKEEYLKWIKILKFAEYFKYFLALRKIRYFCAIISKFLSYIKTELNSQALHKLLS